MPKLFININKHIIAKNNKTGAKDPPIRVSKGRYGKPKYFSEVKGQGWKFIYNPDKPLPCGAKVWFEVEAYPWEEEWDNGYTG